MARTPNPVGAFPVFSEGFDEGFGRAAHGRQRGRFYRSADGALAVIPLGRSAAIGYTGGDVVSADFVYELAVDDNVEFTADEAQRQVATAWAANKTAAAATLKAAIDQALQDAGYRAPDGTDLA